MPDWTGSMPFIQEMQDCDLLSGVEIGEGLAEAAVTALIDTGQALAIRALKVLEWPAKLAIDVVDNPRPNRAGVLVGRYDLVHHAGEGSGFVDGEETPGRSVAAASYTRSGSGRCRESGLQKGSAIESEARLHPGVLDLDSRIRRVMGL